MDQVWILGALKIFVIILFFLLVLKMGTLPLQSTHFQERPLLKAISTTFTGCLFLNVALLHILPESQDILTKYLQGGEDKQVFPLAPLLLLAGFSVTVFFTKVLTFHSHENDEDQIHSVENGTEMINLNLNENLLHSHLDIEKKSVQIANTNKSVLHEAFFLTIAMYFHTIFQGIAIGVQNTVVGFLATSVAISFHKWADALSMGLHYKNNKIDPKISYWLIIIQALLNSLSIATGWIISSTNEVTSAVFLALSAGTFLAISTLEMLGQQFRRKQYVWIKFLMLLGSSGFVSGIWFIEYRVFDK